MTQPRFAELLGVSARTVQDIEVGKLPLNDKLAFQYCAATGVIPESIVGRRGEPLAAATGRVYAHADFEAWTRPLKAKNAEDSQRLEEGVAGAGVRLFVLFQAAGVAGRVDGVDFAFRLWVREMFDFFALDGAVETVFRRIANREATATGTISPGAEIHTRHELEEALINRQHCRVMHRLLDQVSEAARNTKAAFNVAQEESLMRQDIFGHDPENFPVPPFKPSKIDPLPPKPTKLGVPEEPGLSYDTTPAATLMRHYEWVNPPPVFGARRRRAPGKKPRPPKA